MVQNVWKLVFLLITLSVIIVSSYGASNEVTSDLKKLAIANNDLGLNLYKTLIKDTTKNVFFSPFSLSNAMGILFDGAEGDTAKQLRSVLGYDAADLPSEEVPSAFNKYLNKIFPENQQENPAYVLNLANKLLVSSDYEVSSSYKKEVQNQYHADIKEVDFQKNSDKIVNDVNNWVKKQTHGKIDQLLSHLDESTILLILNAIYFKGTWKIEFEQKKTKKETFYNDGLDSKAKDVELMHLKAKLPFVSIGGVKALEMPYKGDNISMLILLPDKRDGLQNFEDRLTGRKFQFIQDAMFTSEVIVTFPKFKVEYKRKMVSDFKALGAKDLFTPGVANLSDISPKYEKELYVNQIIHKAAIEVNEEGSEAAAATAVAVAVNFIAPAPPPLSPQEFRADHPFMYAIIDKTTNMMLFLGRVTEL